MNESDSQAPPLFVDLDGTLIATDAMWASFRLLARKRPWRLLALPFYLIGGRAAFKSGLARLVMVDPVRLPYRQDVLDYLREEKARGRRLILATAADRRVAEGVAAHVGLFDEVMASDGSHNLKGTNKLAAIRRRVSGGEFDYVGDSMADIPILRASRVAHLAHPSKRLLRAALASCRLGRVFD